MSQNSSKLHQKTAAYFDQSGRSFDSLYSLEKASAFMRFVNKRFRRDIYERYQIALTHLKEVAAKSVLDVGVGGARYAEGYMSCGIQRVVGIDISSAMIDLAREHVRQIQNSATSFEFVVSNIESFRSEEKFDVVVAMGFFDYMPDPLAVLKRLRELCHHSVIASFPSISFYRTPLRKIRYMIKRCPVFFFRRAEIAEMSQKAGFLSCQVTKIKGAGMDYVAIFRK